STPTAAATASRVPLSAVKSTCSPVSGISATVTGTLQDATGFRWLIVTHLRRDRKTQVRPAPARPARAGRAGHSPHAYRQRAAALPVTGRLRPKRWRWRGNRGPPGLLP